MGWAVTSCVTIFYYVLDLNVDGPEKNELLQMFIYGPSKNVFFCVCA